MLNKHSDHSVADYFNSKLDYEYDERLKTLTVKCETRQHESVSQILNQLVHFMATSNSFYPLGWAEKVRSGGSPSKCSILPLNYSLLTYKLFRIALRLDDNNNSGEFKPDGTIWIKGRLVDFPTLIIEVAHSQTEEDLFKVGKRWLMGSNGRICTVILIKINYPLPVQEVKIWVYRVVEVGEERHITKWGPGIIYRPPPAILPEPDRTLNLSLEDILGEEIESLPGHQRRRHVSIPFHLLARWCHNALEYFIPQNLRRVAGASAKLESRLGKRIRDAESDIAQTSNGDTTDATTTITHSDQDDEQ